MPGISRVVDRRALRARDALTKAHAAVTPRTFEATHVHALGVAAQQLQRAGHVASVRDKVHGIGARLGEEAQYAQSTWQKLPAACLLCLRLAGLAHAVETAGADNDDDDAAAAGSLCC